MEEQKARPGPGPDVGTLVKKCHTQAEQLETTREVSQALRSRLDEMLGSNEGVNRQIAETGAETLRACEEGSTSMGDLVTSFTGLTALFERMDEVVEKISEVEAQMAQVEEIALTTKILSLNATIEASHAGVHGRTFGIIAAQVRSLASNTTVTANRIKESIATAGEAIRDVTSRANAEIQANTAAIDQTSDRFESLSSGIQKIREVSEASLRSLQHDRHEVDGMTSDIGQRVEDNSRFLSDMIGDLTGDRIRDITPEQAIPLFGKLVVLDVRSIDEWHGDLGHISVAQLNALGPSFKSQLDIRSRSSAYLFVCRSGGRSARAARIAQSMGFARVFNLEGGMLRWNEEKRPVERTSAS